MSSWTIYWILQLDSIGVSFRILCFSGVATLVFGVFAFLETGGELLENVPFKKWMKRIFFATVFCAIVTSFIPSTKTAAAMVIVPAIVNNETLQKEAGDLYQLAKQALRDAVTDSEESEQKK